MDTEKETVIYIHKERERQTSHRSRNTKKDRQTENKREIQFIENDVKAIRLVIHHTED